MKICIIELMPYPNTIGGGTTHIKELSDSLRKRGYEVNIISGKSKEGTSDRNVHQVGLVHRPYKSNFLYRVLWELIFIFSASRKIKELNPDICNAQSIMSPSLACAISGHSFVTTTHGEFLSGFDKLWKERKSKIRLLIKKVYQRIERYNLKRTKAVICLGKENYDYYKNKIKNLVIISNGVNLDKFYRVNSRKRDKVIVSIGRFTEQKNVDKIILAMDYLPDYKLYIGGTGPLEEKIKELCHSRKNCQFMGQIKNDKLPSIFNKARFIVIPSLFEGLPITMLEAMGCGVIPISTKVGDIPDVIKNGKNGFLLNNTSPKEIAAKIKIAEKKNLLNISKNAYITMKKNYSWDKISEKHDKLYLSLLN